MIDAEGLLQRASSMPQWGSRADANAEGDLLGVEFRHSLSQNLASKFPGAMREFALDFARIVARWDEVSETPDQLGVLADAEGLIDRLGDLARQADGHIGALNERMQHYRGLIEPHRWAIAKAEMVTREAVLDGLVSAGIGDRFDPRGFFVYILWGSDDPIYVGQSTNVIARLGSHMTDPGKRSATERIQLIRCDSRDQMCSTERHLIARYRPPLNIALKPGMPPVENP